jgi:chorismate mutase
MSFFRLEPQKPFIVAGPCSAESREQLWKTAEGMQSVPFHLFRAGIWKPRTRPGSFEGLGVEALKWLKEIKQHFGFSIAIEVAEADHVEAAVEYGIDCIWIGARTTVNPFQVQHIADALKGIQIPVMVKNPVNPDIDLWQGGIERILSSGITDIAAIHRGFSTYKTTNGYRNQPNWIIPVELKRRFPNLPIITDPSHITGDATLINHIAQKALNIGFDGLMIETHCNPSRALTDAAQQITPQALQNILAQLTVRKDKNENSEANLNLEYLRQVADNIDIEIIELLARRMEISTKMGEIKRKEKITAYQPNRWREILETRCIQGNKLGLDEEYIAALWRIIHDASIKKQLELPI